MKPCLEAIQCGEPGAAAEYTVEPRAQREGQPLAWAAVAAPDQAANLLLCATMLIMMSPWSLHRAAGSAIRRATVATVRS